eukprot:6476303-Amphidinium_carterae.2
MRLRSTLHARQLATTSVASVATTCASQQGDSRSSQGTHVKPGTSPLSCMETFDVYLGPVW